MDINEQINFERVVRVFLFLKKISNETCVCFRSARSTGCPQKIENMILNKSPVNLFVGFLIRVRRLGNYLFNANGLDLSSNTILGLKVSISSMAMSSNSRSFDSGGGVEPVNAVSSRDICS